MGQLILSADQLALRARLINEAKSANVQIVQAVERLAQLPAGIYPSIVLFAIAMVTVPAEFDSKGKIVKPAYNRAFNSWDGFHLNENKDGVIVKLGEYTDKAIFNEPTDQVGVFYQCVTGRHTDAHIPARYNLSGYMRRSDYSDTAWDASGLEEVEGFVCNRLPDNTFERVVSEKNSDSGQAILGQALGAIFGEERDPEGKPFNQLDLQMFTETSTELFANIVMAANVKDPKGRISPRFVNRFDLSLCTHKETAEKPVEEAVALPE